MKSAKHKWSKGLILPPPMAEQIDHTALNPIRMEASQFESFPRDVEYQKTWGKLKHPEDASKHQGAFLGHKEDKIHAHSLN